MSPYFVKVTYLNIVYVDEMPPDCDKVETYYPEKFEADLLWSILYTNCIIMQINPMFITQINTYF